MKKLKRISSKKLRNLFVILGLVILCGSPTQMSPQTTTLSGAKKDTKDTENKNIELRKTSKVNEVQISSMIKQAQALKTKVVYIKVYSKPNGMAKKKYIPINNSDLTIIDSSSAVVTISKNKISVADKQPTTADIIIDSTVTKTKKSFFYRLFKKIKNI